MPVVIDWKIDKPSDGLKDAMYRLALEIAEQGEYDKVVILSAPKTTTAGRSAKPHFKVLLEGTDNGRQVFHQHQIFIEHQCPLGSRRYNMNHRDSSYPYPTLVAVNKPPSNCPKNRRLQREKEAAAESPDGWYPDPWTTQSSKAERYYANKDWTSYTR
ncbi:hypothetical protein MY8738_005692 [Beauveria namnaoensis]